MHKQSVNLKTGSGNPRSDIIAHLDYFSSINRNRERIGQLTQQQTTLGGNNINADAAENPESAPPDPS